MIYFLVSTSLFYESETRKKEYINGITKLKNMVDKLNIKNSEIIIIENNGERKTFLDDFGCKVFYTYNNFIQVRNKGYKELRDIRDCIDKFKIQDDDFIVKITGRYILEEESEFMNVIAKIHETPYDCVIKYGNFGTPLSIKVHDCITGLIGMRCSYVKKIVYPNDFEHVEVKWADATYMIEDAKIHIVDKLGISICPVVDINGMLNEKYFVV